MLTVLSALSLPGIDLAGINQNEPVQVVFFPSYWTWNAIDCPTIEQHNTETDGD